MQHPALDLRGIYRREIKALWRLNCASNRRTTLEVEPVAAIASARSKRSSSRVMQVNRSRSATCHPAQRCRAGLQEGRFLGKARFRQATNSFVFVLAQKVAHEGVVPG